jgi:phosphate-selective porin OprO/OprP
MKYLSYAFCVATIAGSISAHAEDTGVFSKGLTGETTFDKIWSAGTFYKDNSNPIIEEFDFIGRYQMDFFDVSSDKGNTDFTEIRRFRLGEDAFFFNRHAEIKAEVDTNLSAYGKDSVFYNRMTSLFLNLHFDDTFNVKIGKQEPHFGYDREQSDTVQPFFERSFFDDNVFNKSSNDYQSAVTAFGKIGDFGYLASVISDDVDREFGEFKGGHSYLAEVNYDFKKALCADKALWVLDYMHTDSNSRSDVFNTIDNAVATYFDYKNGVYGLVGQLGFGDGIASKGDFYQVMVMPTYDITSKLQAVFRYQYGHGSQDNTIGLLNRQDSTVGKFTGDEYNAAYLGFNYFIYGNKVRLMAGTEYFDLSGGTGAHADNSGWNTMVGFRIFW